MPVNGKTADRMRDEFYEALRREREERNEAFRQEREERLAASRRFEEEMRRRQIERDAEWKKITGEWGRFNNDEGGMVEYEGVSALRDLPEIGGMRIAAVFPAPPPAKKGARIRRDYFLPRRAGAAGIQAAADRRRRAAIHGGAVARLPRGLSRLAGRQRPLRRGGGRDDRR